MTADYVTLDRTGDKMPLRGFGCWKVAKEDAENTIYNAIKIGYRLFDGACDYGNEVLYFVVYTHWIMEIYLTNKLFQ